MLNYCTTREWHDTLMEADMFMGGPATLPAPEAPPTTGERRMAVACIVIAICAAMVVAAQVWMWLA